METGRREIEYATRAASEGYGVPMLIWGLIGLFPPAWGFAASPLLAALDVPGETIDRACLWSLAFLVASAIYLTVCSLGSYRRNYGRVTLERRERARAEVRSGMSVIPVIVAFTAGLWADKSIQPPVSLSLLGLAAFALVLWLAKGRGVSSHQMWLGAGIVLLSLFPTLSPAGYGEVYGFSLLEYASLLSGVLGLIVATEGFFDLLILARTLKPLPREEGV